MKTFPHALGGIPGTMTLLPIRSTQRWAIQQWCSERRRFQLNSAYQAEVVLRVRYDDHNGNDHNTLSLCCYGSELSPWRHTFTGYDPELIAKQFPELTPLIPFHLCSSDGPFAYLPNTLFHVEQGDFAAARIAAIWPDADVETLTSLDLETELVARLPRLLEEFRTHLTNAGLYLAPSEAKDL